jgi:hypothetical protein
MFCADSTNNSLIATTTKKSNSVFTLTVFTTRLYIVLQTMAALVDKSKTGSLAWPISMTDGSIISHPHSSTSVKSVFQAYYGKWADKVPSSSFIDDHDHSFPVRDRTHRRPSIGSSSPSDVVHRRMFRRRKSLEARQQLDCLETRTACSSSSSDSTPDLFSLLVLVGTANEECLIHRQLERPVESRTPSKYDIFGDYEVGLKGRGFAMMSSRTGDRDEEQNPAHQHQHATSVEEESCPRRTPVYFRNDHRSTPTTTNSSIRRSGSTGDLDNRSSWGRHRRRASIDPSRRCPPKKRF